MKYSPKYFRPLGSGDAGFTCYRNKDLLLGIEWWRDEDAVKHYSVFSGFAHPTRADVRAVRQARKSIDVLTTRKSGLSNLLWLKQQMYSVIEQIKSTEMETWRFTVRGEDEQRQRVYGRLLRDRCWQLFNGAYYYIV